MYKHNYAELLRNSMQQNSHKVNFITELHGGRKPLLLMVDDLGWNDISYHNSRVHTPFLDELALGGVRLESYYVQPTSTGSRAQLLTGTHEVCYV